MGQVHASCVLPSLSGLGALQHSSHALSVAADQSAILWPARKCLRPGWDELDADAGEVIPPEVFFVALQAALIWLRLGGHGAAAAACGFAAQGTYAALQ